MKDFVAHLFVVLVLAQLLGCANHQVRRSPGPDVSLEQAKAIIVSGKVREIFQPHIGCVALTLKNGHLVTFEQPHLDWVVAFVEDQGLSGAVPVSVE